LLLANAFFTADLHESKRAPQACCIAQRSRERGFPGPIVDHDEQALRPQIMVNPREQALWRQFIRSSNCTW
jgi:hypothetical protein